MKSSKWLVGAATGAALSLCAWGGNKIVTHDAGLAEVKADQKSDREFIKERLDRIEDKVDRLLLRSVEHDPRVYR